VSDQPILRVVRGEPTPDELAALVAVVTGRSAATPPPGGEVTAWTDRGRLVRRSPAPGPGAWRASGWQS
jgi:hypothetical protein